MEHSRSFASIRGFLIFALICFAVPSGFAADAAQAQALTALQTLSAGNATKALEQCRAMESSVYRFYAEALVLQQQGDLKAALEQAAKGTALNAADRDWTARCELLSAELYLAQGMTNSAAAVARQMQLIYDGTAFADKANALSERISNIEQGTPK